MALQYILDGYNIVKQIPALITKDLRQSREKLTQLIEHNRPQGSLKNRVTIVYDGKPGMVVYGREQSHVDVIYSQRESADDTIRGLVLRSKRKKEIVVVTDDKEVQFSVRAHGARIMPVKEFLAKVGIAHARPKTKKTQTPKAEENKNIPRSTEYRITAEFEKIWLQGDSER